MTAQPAERPTVYRVGYGPDPWRPPPWDVIRNSDGRFDDPRREYRVIYSAALRVAALVESLAAFRPSLELLARLAAMPPGDLDDDTPPLGRIPADWRLKRRIGAAELLAPDSYLDLRSLRTHADLRIQMFREFVALGLTEFDLAAAIGNNRRLTQSISRWAYEQGASGIVYTSRLDASFTCVAIFEGASFDVVGISPIAPNDPDFEHAAGLLKLTIER